MGTARAAQAFAGPLEEVHTAWYDTSRWARWVEGLDHVVDVDGDWPREGGSVTWMSGPAGRGTVTERVIAYRPLAGQTLEVRDTAIRGRQTVSFTSVGDVVEVQLTLAYHLVHGSIVSPLMDLLFIRRAMTSSLARTLNRFGAALAAARGSRPPSVSDPGD
jgi:hypothetical protein